MELIAKDSILKEIPLFSGLSDRERKLIKGRSNIVEYKKDDIIYKEGSPPGRFYCIIFGRVVIYTRGQSGNKTVLEYLHRGKYFGIISLLTNEPHSVTAQAVNDCSLLVIEKDDFDFLIKKIPSLAIDLSQTLSRRLKRKDVHQKTVFESTIISVFSSYSQAGKTIYALNLALSLAKETRKSVIILDILPQYKRHTLPDRLEIKETRIFDLSQGNIAGLGDFILKNEFGMDLACFHYAQEDDSCLKSLLGILSSLVNDYYYIILDLPSLIDRQIFRILNQSDLIQILSSPEAEDLKDTHELIESLKQEFNFRIEKINIIINEYKSSELKYNEQVEILGKDIFATLPKIDFTPGARLALDNPECEYSRAVRRVSRQIGECLVGLVLGVGVGYGFCHIGVLKVIEEEKIPIDIIAGASVGALIASLWAIGKSSDEILKITEEFKGAKSIWGLIDLTVPVLGFIKGNKMHRFLKKNFNDLSFSNTKIPLKIIASDVKRKQARVFDKGPLVDAIMASCAMPGVFTPFKFKEEMLFDGGVINPLPTEPLIELGVRKIIAVNVTPSRQDILQQYEKMKSEIVAPAKKHRSWFNLNWRLKNSFKTNILDIIFSSVEVLQSTVAQQEAQLADIVLHPDTSGMYWLELHRAKEFVKRGEEEARKNLDRIKQLVNE